MKIVLSDEFVHILHEDQTNEVHVRLNQRLVKYSELKRALDQVLLAGED